MNLDDIRKKFEARFPVPVFVVWDSDRHTYKCSVKCLAGHENTIRYRARWETWKAAMESLNHEGYVLVPENASQAMCYAAKEEMTDWQTATFLREGFLQGYASLYKAMIRARPSIDRKKLEGNLKGEKGGIRSEI